jgi:hypothetical protein
MTVMKRRTRMISVRLSQEEYAALRDMCSLTGARSVSDVTRDAVRAVLRTVTREDSSVTDFEEFRSGMKSLEQRVERLEAKITILGGETIQ